LFNFLGNIPTEGKFFTYRSRFLFAYGQLASEYAIGKMMAKTVGHVDIETSVGGGFVRQGNNKKSATVFNGQLGRGKFITLQVVETVRKMFNFCNTPNYSRHLANVKKNRLSATVLFLWLMKRGGNDF